MYSVNVDTLHLNVRYPRKDVFERWHRVAKGFDSRILNRGVPEGDFVVKGGKGGYKVGVWSNDIRAFLTDEVDELRGDGMGMGIWIQIGPKFLIDHSPGSSLSSAVDVFLKGLGVKHAWEIRITRIDLALDLLGIDLLDQCIQSWVDGWVGRSRVSSFFLNSTTGALETINIGSRKSPVYLRVYDKVAEALADADLQYWRDVWKDHDGPATRIEWEVKPRKGGFGDLENFDELCERRIAELLNYLVGWGRLCVPNKNDSNRRRWPASRFWNDVELAAKDWTDAITWPTSRYGRVFRGITDGYIRGVAGTLSGAMARFNPNDPTLSHMLESMNEHGHGLRKIQKVAENKGEIIART